MDDGWCGFRTLAYIVYKDQEKYLDVKEKMYSYVKDNRDICTDYICIGHRTLYDELLQRMAYGVAPQLRTRSACRKEYWFDLAFDIQVAANTFNLPLASYSDSIHESALYLPYDIPAGQPLPEIIYFVHGNYFQTIRTKRFPRMIWPPVSPKSLAIWESRGRDPKLYKAAWKYIHREKYPVAQNSDETGKNPMTLEGDGGKSQIKKDELQELNELLAAADAIELEPEGTLYYN